MGNTLHNKIYLGRRSAVFRSRGMAALILLTLFASAGAAWMLYGTVK